MLWPCHAGSHRAVDPTLGGRPDLQVAAVCEEVYDALRERDDVVEIELRDVEAHRLLGDLADLTALTVRVAVAVANKG
jgi:hypothetical protein